MARSFNEAGPQGAGKPSRRRPSPDDRCRFNEAGPQGAGKPRPDRKKFVSPLFSFNEAGPQGAGKPYTPPCADGRSTPLQ